MLNKIPVEHFGLIQNWKISQLSKRYGHLRAKMIVMFTFHESPSKLRQPLCLSRKLQIVLDIGFDLYSMVLNFNNSL